MTMLFYQSLDKRYTKTPNVFFEEVLCAKGTTFNEAKLMGYIIRNTLGFNHKATWIKVSRSQLSQKAQISYGSINPTIQSCIQKGWILEFKQGEKGREERYLFLRTPQNEQIIQELEEGEFQLSDLGRVTYADLGEIKIQDKIENSHCKNKQPTDSNTEHDTYSLDEQGDTTFGQGPYSTLKQECSKIEQSPSTKIEQAPYSSPEHVNMPSGQSYQGVEAPLKTNTKDNNKKDNNTQLLQNVVCVQDQIMNLFNKKISSRNVEALILLAEKEQVNLPKIIENTHEYHTKVEPCRNVFGAIKYALETGGWHTEAPTPSEQPERIDISGPYQRELERKKKYLSQEPTDPEMLAKIAAQKKRIVQLYADREEPIASIL